MSHFTLHSTEIPNLTVIEKRRLTDARGHLMRMFCEVELASIGWSGKIAQINQTKTLGKGTVRGC